MIVESSTDSSSYESQSHDEPANVDESTSVESENLFRWKKLKITIIQSQMRDQTNTAVSQQTPVVLGAPTSLFASTISSYSYASSTSVSFDHGDNTLVESQEDPMVHITLRYPGQVTFIILSIRICPPSSFL